MTETQLAVHGFREERRGQLVPGLLRSKELGGQQTYDPSELHSALPFTVGHLEEARRLLGYDFWSYGVEPNRPTIEAMCRYVMGQGIAPSVVSPEALFVPADR